MTRTNFSWIHPAACFGLPELEDNRCAICGNLSVDCSCLECEHPVILDGRPAKCGVRGCLEHLLDRQLVSLMEVLESRVSNLRSEAKRRELPTMPCPVCGDVQIINVFNSGPYVCHGFFYAGEKYGWMKKDRY